MNQTLRGGTLKDFQIINKLGEGSFSQVFKVKRLSDGQEYAMKKVKMQLLKEKEKENSLNEVRILASISDEYIVGYKEAFIDNNELYVIMEYCPKGDIQILLNQYLAKQQFLEEKEIWKAFLHIIKGLSSLHEMKILHRDLKCANIFISKEGNYKLGDLNVSKIAKKGLVYTQTGTPYYAAPEIWKDQPYDLKCDIWSLACVIYEMCAQHPPFRAVDLEGLNKKIQKGAFDRIPAKYSNDLQQIIQQCLQTHPSKRPDTKQILSNPLFIKNTGFDQSSIVKVQSQKQELLSTIKCPLNLIQLKGKLPRSKYNIEKPSDLNQLENLYEPRKNRALSAVPTKSEVNLPVNTSNNNQSQQQQQQNYQAQMCPPSGNQRPPLAVNNNHKNVQQSDQINNYQQNQGNKQNINLNNNNNLQSRQRVISCVQENINPNNQQVMQNPHQQQQIKQSQQENKNLDLYSKYNNVKNQKIEQIYARDSYNRPYSAREILESKLKLPPLSQVNQDLNQKLNNRQLYLLGSYESNQQQQQMNRYQSEKNNIIQNGNLIRQSHNPSPVQESNYQYNYYNNAHRQIRRLY